MSPTNWKTVKIYRLGETPVTLTVDGGCETIEDLCSHPESGKVLNERGSLAEAAERLYSNGMAGLGQFRLNGENVDFSSPISFFDGDSIVIVPNVKVG